MFLLGGSLSPAGLTVSFLEAPLSRVVERLTTWREGLGQSLEVSPADLSSLRGLPFESPWTREVLLDCGDWTAYLNNDIGGGDPTAAAPYLSAALGVRCVIAMHAPPHGPGHASTQLWLLGPDGVPPLMYVRTISAIAEDGRWSWHVSGIPQPFERRERYHARRIRDRLDRPLLVGYLAALGIDVDRESFFEAGVLVRQRVTYSVRTMTADEVREEFGW